MSYNSVVTSTNSSEIPTTPNGYPYMTAAIYWCLDGRKFDDGTTVRTLNCVGNGHWSYSSVHCDCTYVIYTVSKKTVQICFCQNVVKFTSIMIIFGRKMAKRINLYEMDSFLPHLICVITLPC